MLTTITLCHRHILRVYSPSTAVCWNSWGGFGATQQQEGSAMRVHMLTHFLGTVGIWQILSQTGKDATLTASVWSSYKFIAAPTALAVVGWIDIQLNAPLRSTVSLLAQQLHRSWTHPQKQQQAEVMPVNELGLIAGLGLHHFLSGEHKHLLAPAPCLLLTLLCCF